MKDGVCPKCGSHEIHRGQSAGIYDSIFIGEFLSTPIRTTFYLCADCGYMERYVLNADARRRLVEKWLRIGEKKKNDE